MNTGDWEPLAALAVEGLKWFQRNRQVREAAGWRVAPILSDALADLDRKLSEEAARAGGEMGDAILAARDLVFASLPQEYAEKVQAIRARQAREEAERRAEQRLAEQAERRAHELLGELLAQGFKMDTFRLSGPKEAPGAEPGPDKPEGA